MYFALVFAGVIAGVAFVIGAIGELFDTEASLLLRFLRALSIAGMTFVASLILVWRDQHRHASAQANVQEMLLARDDMDDESFLAPFPDVDPELLLQIRKATAQIFEVPATKIYPADRPDEDFQFPAMAPMPYFFIIGRILEERRVHSEHVMANPAKFTDFRTLSLEMQSIIDKCTSGDADRDQAA